MTSKHKSVLLRPKFVFCFSLLFTLLLASIFYADSRAVPTQKREHPKVQWPPLDYRKYNRQLLRRGGMGRFIRSIKRGTKC